MRVLIADDHALFRDGLMMAISRSDDLCVVGHAEDGAHAVELAKALQPDVITLDILMPSGSGISAAAELRDSSLACRVLGISVIEEPVVIADMLRAGATGYALKGQPPKETLDAIRTVSSGTRYLPPRLADAVLENFYSNEPDRLLDRLTQREREVFEMLIRGFNNSEVAAKLFISRRTVETHRLHIVRKLSVHGVIEMQRLAARFGGLT